MINFPRNYKNCIRYVKENYPNHEIYLHANWDQDNAIYIIDNVIHDGKKIDIWINVWLLIKNEKHFHVLESCINMINTANIKSLILQKCLELYNYALYPELLAYENRFYLNGEIFFSEDDYENKSLSVIEQAIRRTFSNYRVSIDLFYEDQISGSIMGVLKLNESFKSISKDAQTVVSGKIIFQMLTQEPRKKIYLLFEKVKELLARLSQGLRIIFESILLVINNGFETYNLGEILSKCNLSGGYIYKEIRNNEY
ncbi:hypothetical protein LA02_1239 [Francisella philomiragia]|uniref:hypothetical protein n=1 Tax=Francisella philomiragia TaxID=28110 RepID=UPI0005A57338|nr:hypothetical protein [Francisella philomiragia]AJI57219.1 hypothetical protein LA02_1239 [Francisella philomiragia]